jgi:L-rhamnose-H+ transport protein
MWGLVLKEWKGVSKKTVRTVVFGIVTIILAVLIVGLGNIIHDRLKEKQKTEKAVTYVNSNKNI